MLLHKVMRKIFKIKNNTKSGFTLVETLVALSIFSLAIVALMVILGAGLKDTNYAKSKIVAGFLAEEGIELMRNLRDTHVLYDGQTNGWAFFLADVDECNNQKCIFHTEELSSLSITDINIESCDQPECMELYYHESTGSYDHTAINGVRSGFLRYLSIEPLDGGDHEARIHSVVFWNDAQAVVSFTENIFDWNH